jgi:uncharacterized protein YjbI with pentapeptide repeats
LSIGDLASRDLIARWTTAEGRTLSETIFRRLARGAQIRSLNIPDHDGRLDLRGIGVAEPHVVANDDRTVLGRILRVEQLSNVQSISKAELVGIDFSHAQLSSLKLKDSLIENCVFDGAQLYRVGMWGCRVESSSFRAANLRSAVLGGTWKTPTLYGSACFVEADLRECVPGLADFFDCRLLECTT